MGYEFQGQDHLDDLGALGDENVTPERRATSVASASPRKWFGQRLSACPGSPRSALAMRTPAPRGIRYVPPEAKNYASAC